MQYDIQYKVTATRHGGFLCKKSNLFPVLSIRYRKSVSRKWTHLGNTEIDLYTYHRFRSTYYKDFRSSTTYLETLERKSDYERLTLFMDILNTEFDGDIAKLVESVVREILVMNHAEEEENADVNRLVTPLLIDGWKTTEIDV